MLLNFAHLSTLACALLLVDEPVELVHRYSVLCVKAGVSRLQLLCVNAAIRSPDDSKLGSAAPFCALYTGVDEGVLTWVCNPRYTDYVCFCLQSVVGVC